MSNLIYFMLLFIVFFIGLLLGLNKNKVPYYIEQEKLILDFLYKTTCEEYSLYTGQKYVAATTAYKIAYDIISNNFRNCLSKKLSKGESDV